MTINDIFLDFGTDPNATLAIRERLCNKNRKCAYLRVTTNSTNNPPTINEAAIFNQVDAATRIFIMAHGETGYPEDIYGYTGVEGQSSKEFFNYKQISDYLKNRLPIEKIKAQDHNLKISLIVCFSGTNESHFAVKLHRDIAQRLHLKTDMLARQELATVIQNAKEHTGKIVVRTAEEKNIDNRTDFLKEYFNEWVEDQHQKPGTKAKLTWDQKGQEIMVDAYIAKFAKISMDVCQCLKKQIDSNPSLDLNAISVIKELNDIVNSCRDIELLTINEMGLIGEKLKPIILLANISNSEIASKLNKIYSIAAKYTNIANKESNALNFCNFATLASKEMMDILTQNINNHSPDKVRSTLLTLNSIISICDKKNAVTDQEIKQVVSALKNTKNIIYNSEGTTKDNILKSYKFARKALYTWKPIEPKVFVVS